MSFVKSIMKRNVVRVDPGASALEAARLMRENGLGALLVVEDDSLQGILTERDLLNRLVAQDLPASETRVRDLATRDPITVEEDTPVKACAHLMMEHRIRHLPVVDDANRPVGILSSRDFLQYVVDDVEPLVDRAYRQGLVSRLDPNNLWEPFWEGY